MKKALKAGGAVYVAPIVLSAASSLEAVAAQVSPAPTTGPTPTITTIVPNGGPTPGGTPVTITGTNFCVGATVTFGGIAATGVTVVNATTITLRTPPGTAGPVNVVITCPNGTATTVVNGFTYRACTLTGEAFGASATIAPLLALGRIGDVVLPPGGTTNVASIAAAPLLTSGLLTNSTADTSTATLAGATSSSTVNNLAATLLAIGISATVIRTVANSTTNGITAASTDAGTTFTNLVINGAAVAVPAPNTNIALLGIGNVIVNEQIPTGNGTNTTGLTVNGLHIFITVGGLLGLPVGEIIVASARSGASCL